MLQRKFKQDRRTQENRKDRSSVSGRGGFDLFGPQGPIGRGPEVP